MATLQDVIRLQGKPEADEKLLEILNEHYTMDLDKMAPDGSQLIRTASGAMYDPEYIDVLDWTDTGDALRVEVILQWQDGSPHADYEQTHLMVEIDKEMEELSLEKAPERIQ